jgi:hypothetical protein
MNGMSLTRIVVCLLPSGVIGLATRAALRAAIPNPLARALVGLAVMPAVGWVGSKSAEHMVRWTEGKIA